MAVREDLRLQLGILRAQHMGPTNTLPHHRGSAAAPSGRDVSLAARRGQFPLGGGLPRELLLCARTHVPRDVRPVHVEVHAENQYLLLLLSILHNISLTQPESHSAQDTTGGVCREKKSSGDSIS